MDSDMSEYHRTVLIDSNPVSGFVLVLDAD